MVEKGRESDRQHDNRSTCQQLTFTNKASLKAISSYTLRDHQLGGDKATTPSQTQKGLREPQEETDLRINMGQANSRSGKSTPDQETLRV
ncbi:hypothetical protein A2U01_0000627 [Trifolium medium]|uniref:Uncharacterized protein n=1 Tax=Trifolium medium TaxID=97028 RepID=A0A392LY39_9FABA|nr:hypothetical protein [Trifolium medium]